MSRSTRKGTISHTRSLHLLTECASSALLLAVCGPILENTTQSRSISFYLHLEKRLQSIDKWWSSDVFATSNIDVLDPQATCVAAETCVILGMLSEDLSIAASSFRCLETLVAFSPRLDKEAINGRGFSSCIAAKDLAEANNISASERIRWLQALLIQQIPASISLLAALRESLRRFKGLLVRV